MSRSFQNLARDPFVNSRPVVRVSIVLWMVAIALLAGNIWLYWDFLAGREDTYTQLEKVERAIRETRQRTADLDAKLAAFDLAEQNQQVAFLNNRIERRLFSWSDLFDELSSLLPNNVQITRLSPTSAEGEAGGRRSSRSDTRRDELGEGMVLLKIDALARDDASILATIDALWEDPAFDQPNLISQAAEDGGMIRFDLETIYEPQRQQVAPPEPAEAKADTTEDRTEDETEDGERSATSGTPPAGPSNRNDADHPTRLGTAASSAPEVR